MSAEKITLKLLQKNWWWRRKEIRRRKRDPDWKYVQEAARNYELMRRVPGGEEFTKTYADRCYSSVVESSLQ